MAVNLLDRLKGKRHPRRMPPDKSAGLEKIRVQTRTDQVAIQLLRYIETARLKPGSRLPAEAKLADEFGVSRPVVREAIRDLTGKGVVEVVKDVVENKKKDQVATRVAFSGNIENPDADVIQAVLQVLRNGFIEALRRGLEPAIGDQRISRQDNKSEQ